ncbi:hypothetical protein FN960_01780 [Alkalicoccobacillus porphyridii]|uniref:Uncharacterized protein n=1 Tax=Alkalicoccobacillus porphyridii TaxID=2597270 RepID=A0A554A3P2_9BACI|nr:hypothetical protein FN960_01780 [Alkalicoccobacillus porphyridii]
MLWVLGIVMVLLNMRRLFLGIGLWGLVTRSFLLVCGASFWVLSVGSWFGAGSSWYAKLLSGY